MGTIDYSNPKYYYNRELSWLKFNERILSEARDKNNLLMERLKFLSITASNLDEFFMVRVASLKNLVEVGADKPDIAGLTPNEQLNMVSEGTHEFVNAQYATLNRSLIPHMEKEGIKFVQADEYTEEEKAYLDKYFEKEVFPVLTPMAVDSSRPFPLIKNKSLNIGALLQKKDGTRLGKKVEKNELELALVQVPSVLPRYIVLPGNNGVRLVLLENEIKRHMSRLFMNYEVLCAHAFRVMRNADLDIDEEEAEDLLEEISSKLKQRQRGDVIRLEVEADIKKNLLKKLKSEFNIENEDVYPISGPIDLTFFMSLYGLKGYDEHRVPKHVPCKVPALTEEESIFDLIAKHDILLHHPYQTFDPVVRFVDEASRDPEVLAIKQTLYRVSGNSPIVAALSRAAENGKQVSVLVELKARFDEEHNIVWAKKLEKAGCHVIYGLVGLKTHCKITLVVRKEEDGIRRYVHLGTGNYNDSTAKLYTDMGILTCDAGIGEDATAVFNMLSGYSEPLGWNELSLAPLWLKDRLISLINKERDNALAGKQARIKAKMNSLCDPDVISALYEASSSGVKIDLIVRGICCLRSGIPGVSDNIRVKSIVGNFLEHARIFCFENDGTPRVFLASADWMPRNLDRRVEIMFPVKDEELKTKVLEVLDTQLADNMRSHILMADGTYEKVDRRGKDSLDCQKEFVKRAKAEQKSTVSEGGSRVFVPRESDERKLK